MATKTILEWPVAKSWFDVVISESFVLSGGRLMKLVYEHLEKGRSLLLSCSNT